MVYSIIPVLVKTEPQAGTNYVYGYCYMVDANGDFVKYMGDSTKTKLIHLRAAGNPTDAIEPIPVSDPSGRYTISPLQPQQQWEIAMEDQVKQVWSPWFAWATNYTQTQIDFIWTPSPEPTPEPSENPIDAIRNEAWEHLNIPYNPSAAFPEYARQHNMGNPTTPEFDVEGYRAQGFQAGIIYCKIGDWANISTVPW